MRQKIVIIGKSYKVEHGRTRKVQVPENPQANRNMEKDGTDECGSQLTWTSVRVWGDLVDSRRAAGIQRPGEVRVWLSTRKDGQTGQPLPEADGGLTKNKILKRPQDKRIHRETEFKTMYSFYRRTGNTLVLISRWLINLVCFHCKWWSTDGCKYRWR